MAPPDSNPDPASLDEAKTVASGGAQEGREAVALEFASDVRAAIAPVGSAMKADVGSLTTFLRGIQSGYLLAGLGLLAATGVVGVLVTLIGGFSDWYMHLAMYVVLSAFALLYVRAHQKAFRVMRAIWAIIGLALIAYFMFILLDLMPQRLDVLSNRPRPGGFTGIDVVLRERADGLWAPVVMLGLVALWLVSHWLFLSRYRAPWSARASVSEPSVTDGTELP